jgi:hypothetical protein
VIQRSGLALDVSIPETLLATADEVIEQAPFAATHFGTSRHFAATRQFGRFLD